jgi:hypothetical protein
MKTHTGTSAFTRIGKRWSDCCFLIVSQPLVVWVGGRGGGCLCSNKSCPHGPWLTVHTVSGVPWVQSNRTVAAFFLLPNCYYQAFRWTISSHTLPLPSFHTNHVFYAQHGILCCRISENLKTFMWRISFKKLFSFVWVFPALTFVLLESAMQLFNKIYENGGCTFF